LSNPQLRSWRILQGRRFRLGRPLLLAAFARSWPLVLVRAVAAILLGAFAIAFPRLAAFSLVYLFGGFAMVDGLVALWASVRGGWRRARWWLTVVGLTSVAAGVFTLAEPRTAALLMIVILGVWLIVRGLAHILGAVSMREELGADWSLPIDGLLSALFGAGLIVVPKVGALGLVWAVGIWALVDGALMIPFALRLRRASMASDRAA